MLKKSLQKKSSSSDEQLKLTILLKGVILAYIITIPFFILFSLILSYTNFPENYISTAVTSVTIISVLISSTSVSRNIKNKGLFSGAFIGFFYMFILYIINGIVFKNYSITRHLITMTFICILTGSVGGIMGVNIGTGKRSRIKSRPKRGRVR
ncbi:MAG TPA: TIGR04086 family membrane protein [Clostridiales bacterium]|nr:TIGR04086 family membrane protein [Clostridiales bacterium]